MALLTQQDKQKVSSAIAAVEELTDAEIVAVLARQSDDYHYIPTLWAAIIALLAPSLIMLTPLWLELWEVITGQIITFIVLAVFLRIPWIMIRLIPQRVRFWRASNMARRQFLENNLHHTKDETGLLIFVSELEHYVEIIADRGISLSVEDAQWQEIVSNLTRQIKAGHTLEGLLECISACGEITQKVAPLTSPKNELANHLIVLE